MTCHAPLEVLVSDGKIGILSFIFSFSTTDTVNAQTYFGGVLLALSPIINDSDVHSVPKIVFVFFCLKLCHSTRCFGTEESPTDIRLYNSFSRIIIRILHRRVENKDLLLSFKPQWTDRLGCIRRELDL